MKQPFILFTLLVLSILLLLTIQGCHKEKETENIPPPEFYEFNIRVGDGAVYLFWHFPQLRDSEFGVEVNYYLDGVKKVQRVMGINTMTISGLNNNESYELTLVRFDGAGNKSEGSNFTVVPHTPFVVVSPTSSDGYIIEDGKVRIDLRFNRPADTTSIDRSFMKTFIQLSAGLSYSPGLYDNAGLSNVLYSYSWRENGMILSILTEKPKELLCTGFPCYLYLRFHFSWRGATFFYGISDTNGIQLDADKDGQEMGDAKLIFILE